jgi:hypothetical protein
VAETLISAIKDSKVEDMVIRHKSTINSRRGTDAHDKLHVDNKLSKIDSGI